jgi:hypothetical protein
MQTPPQETTQTPHRQNPPSTQTRKAFALKIATITAATVALFCANLTNIFSHALQNESALYILAVPFIFLYLTYRKRKLLRAVMPLNRDTQPKTTISLSLLAGILVAAAALLLYLQDSYVLTPLETSKYTFAPPTFHILLLPIFAAGLILIFFNPQTLKQLILPLIPLFFLILPSDNTQAVALLGSLLLVSAAAIIFLLGTERGFKSILVKNPDTCPQCAQETQSNRNYCRECSRIFHPANTRIQKTDIAGTVLVLLIIGLLLTIQSPVFAINKLPQVTVIDNTQGPQYMNTLPNETNQYKLAQTLVDQHLGSQGLTALGYTYTALPNVSLDDVYVGLDLSSSSQSNLIAYSALPRSIQLNYTTVQLNTSGPPTKAIFFANLSTDVDKIEAVLYWNISPIFMINQTAEQKQATIALTVFPSQDKLPQAEQQLINLANDINNYWLPNENWPQTTARFLTQNSLTLSAAASAGIVATALYYTADNRKRNRKNQIALSKLNAVDTQIVKALQTTSKPATLANIVATFQKNTGQNTTPEQLETHLKELEKADIIKSQVSCRNNTPIQTWKT